ncbi:hypothetical protein EJB05_23545, partial [Eragrostis curvula]
MAASSVSNDLVSLPDLFAGKVDQVGWYGEAEGVKAHKGYPSIYGYFEISSLLEPSCWPQNKLVFLPVSMISDGHAIFAVHFWAPTFKWCLNIANVAEFTKPPEEISYPQQLALGCSGLIWARYSRVITPVNLLC